MDDKTKIITLMTFDTVGEAEIYRTLLESAGVHSLVQNDIIAGMLPTTDTLLRVRLYVNKEDEALAREVLSAKFDTEEFAAETHTKAPKKK